MRELRLVVDLFGLSVIQKSEDKSKYEEITIPGKLKYWPPSITYLRELRIPDQDACDYFISELETGGANRIRLPITR